MHCPRCGASVTVPDDLYVETTRCAYCGTVSPLPEELAQARQAEASVALPPLRDRPEDIPSLASHLAA